MSARPEFKGDFMGFTYGTDAKGNPVHSSDLGIVRVSDGSRFNQNLLPTMQDKTVQVPGGDGTYYFGSYYTQRQFTVSFAFDSLTEQEIRQIKAHFGDKKIHDLIFDETPYKVWSAKVTGTATIKYIPFDEGSTHRLYKGEGSIQFTCYLPFARCWSIDRYKYFNHPAYKGMTSEQIQEKIEEWWVASGIDVGDPMGTNFGDVPVPFKATISGENKIEFDENNWVAWNLPSEVTGVLDTRTGMAISDASSKDLLNKYLSGNPFLTIPVGAQCYKDVNGNQQDLYYDYDSANLRFDCLYL